jgi:Lon protease-like protein
MHLPLEAPVMILPNAILFPQAMLPLYIFEPRYRKMLSDSLHGHRMFTVAMQKPGRTRETPSPIGGLGLIRASVANKDGTSHLILQGLARVRLAETVQYKPYRVQRIRPLEEEHPDTVVIDALVAKVRELVADRLAQGFEPPGSVVKKLSKSGELKAAKELATSSMEQFVKHLSALEDPGSLADMVCCALLGNPLERQIILENVDLESRLKNLIHFLMVEVRASRKGKS